MGNVVLISFCLSVVANAVLAFLLYKKKHTTLTVDAKQMLHDLTKGKALLEVRVLDPAGLFYRSPRA